MTGATTTERGLDRETRREMFYWMLLARRFDERMVAMWKQGRGVGGTFSQRGHEAISVAAAMALDDHDVVAPMHRDLGCYLVRGVTPRRIFGNLLGREIGVSRGRDANLHGMGDMSLGIIGFVSHLPHSMPVALGAAMTMRDDGRVALTFTGDGSSSAGLFHETLNLASVYGAPLVVVVENNQYAYSTPLHQQMKVPDIAARAAIYGMPGTAVDGNDPEEVYAAVAAAVDRARRGGGPSLVEARTMRMLGHAIHDGAEYVPAELLEEWRRRDPIESFQARLLRDEALDEPGLAELESRVTAEIEAAVATVEGSAFPDPATVTDRVFAESPAFPPPSPSPTREMTYLEAITDAMRVEMRRDPAVLVLGEDVGGSFGGAFKATRGLPEEFGDDRVLNTPLAELGFTGMATGMALFGRRPIVEMQFADFISSAFDSIVQFAATTHYRWGGRVAMTIRAPSDGGIRAGPFHSQNPEAWFVHTPGLKVVSPSNPADAKGLLAAAIRDDNPVIFFECKPLYRSERGPVPEGEHVVPIGKAAWVRHGGDISILAYGAQVREALAASSRLAEDGIEAAVLDLRTLKPLDEEAILDAAARTGKVLVVHSANRLAGVGAEVAALVADRAFHALDAPVRRLGGLDTPVPFSPPLEDAYRPAAEDIYREALDLVRH